MIKLPGQMRFLWLSMVVIIADLLSKQLASHYLSQWVPHTIFPGFDLVLVRNYGSAFGFLYHADGWQTKLFIGFAIVVTIILLIWLARLSHTRGNRWSAIAITLIIGGALGNFIDRAVHGYVVDFIDVYIGQYHWPAFNLADSCISIGAIMLIWRLWRH